MALTSRTAGIQIRRLNQQSPPTNAIVGELETLTNKLAVKFEGVGEGEVLRVESRDGYAQKTLAVRDVTFGDSISPTAGVPSANLLSSIGTEMVAVSGSRPYVLAEDEPAWSKYADYVYSPVVAKEKPVYMANSQVANPDAANVGSIYLRIWSEPATVNGVTGAVRLMVVDADGTPIRKPFVLTQGFAASSRAKVVSDGVRFWVVWQPSGGTVVTATCYDTNGLEIDSFAFVLLDIAERSWDLTFCAGKVLFAQGSSSPDAVSVSVLTISGTTISAVTSTLGFALQGDHGVAWAENADNDGNAYLMTSHFDPDGGDLERAARIGNLGTTPSVTSFFSVPQTSGSGIIYASDGEGGANQICSEMTGIYRGGVLYAQLSFFHATDVRQSRIVPLTCVAGATATALATVRSVMSASRVFQHDGRDVLLVYYPQAPTVTVSTAGVLNRLYSGQPTYFLLDVLTRQCCGRFNSGSAAMEWARVGYPVNAAKDGPFLFCVPHVFSNAGIVHVPCGVLGQSFNQTNSFTTSISTVRVTTTVISAVGYQDVELGGHGEAIEAAGELLMPGALCTSFDGLNFSENSLNLAPEQPSAAQGTGGSLALLGTYSYVVVFQALTRFGDRILSAVAPPVSITLTGSNNKVTLTGFPLHMTNRRDVTIAIYRTIMESGVTGNTHRRIDNPLNPLTNDPTALTWTFVDTVSDVSASSGEPLYTDAGFLQRDPMPSFNTATEFDGRVCCVGPDNAIWYSAQKTDGDALWFSLSQRIPRFTDEPILNLVAMDGRLVAITDRSVWLQDAGGMVDPKGENGNLRPAVKQTFTNGGSGFARLLDLGVVYSSSQGGLWLITRGGTNELLSGPVADDIKASVIKGITVDAAKRMHVALTSSFLVFDQVSGVWSKYITPTSPLLIHSFRGNAIFADETCVMSQTPGKFTDDDGAGGQAFIVGSFSFQPFNLAGLKNFSHLWQFNLQGTSRGNFTLSMTAVYDVATNPTPEVWTWAVTPTDGLFSAEFQPKLEQMETMYLTFLESFPAGPSYDGQTFTLEAIGLTVGVEAGLARVPLARRIQST